MPNGPQYDESVDA